MILWDCDGVILDTNRVVVLGLWFCFEGGKKREKGGRERWRRPGNVVQYGKVPTCLAYFGLPCLAWATYLAYLPAYRLPAQYFVHDKVVSPRKKRARMLRLRLSWVSG